MLKLSLNATLLDAIIHDSELGLEPRIFSLDKSCFNLLSYSERYIQLLLTSKNFRAPCQDRTDDYSLEDYHVKPLH